MNGRPWSEETPSREDGADGCASFVQMRIATGKIVQGRVEIEGDLPEEGTTVTILVPERDEGFELAPEELVELEAALGEIARGESIDGASLIRELRR
ncbi:MAG: hypothetical protein R3F21_23900 [Myxococcota bacterium]